MKSILMTAVLLGLVGISGAADKGPANGEQGGRRGVVKAVDASGSKLTVTVSGEKKEPLDMTFAVGADAKIQVDGAAGKLGDLTPGTLVAVVESADKKSLEAIRAEGPWVQGVVKSVDPAQRTLAVTVRSEKKLDPAEDRSFTLAENAVVFLDDGRSKGKGEAGNGKLGDIPTGASVGLKLTVNRQSVVGVRVQGQSLFGTVKSVDAGAGTLTIKAFVGKGPGEGEDKTLKTDENTRISLEDGSEKGKGEVPAVKLADVPVGSVVRVGLTVDGKGVVSIRAEGATVAGVVKAVDAAKGSVTLTVSARKGEPGEDKTFTVPATARILVGKPKQGEKAGGKLADVTVGSSAMIRLSPDGKSVIGLMAERPEDRVKPVKTK